MCEYYFLDKQFYHFELCRELLSVCYRDFCLLEVLQIVNSPPTPLLKKRGVCVVVENNTHLRIKIRHQIASL